jgi:hypothetical protein
MMNGARVDEKDVLAAACEAQGVGTDGSDQMCLVETSGGLSIIPLDDLAAFRVNAQAT